MVVAEGGGVEAALALGDVGEGGAAGPREGLGVDGREERAARVDVEVGRGADGVLDLDEVEVGAVEVGEELVILPRLARP